MPQYTQANPQKSKRNRVHLLLAVAALAIASLACFNTELTLIVSQQEGAADSLDVSFQQYLIPSYVEAAKQANAERAADFQAAGRDSEEALLPTKLADIEDGFDIQKYQDAGFSVQQSETGFSAARTYSLDQDRSMEDWKVRVIQNPEHPEQITYRVKVFIDLTETDLEDLQGLRNEPQMEKLDPNDVGEEYSGGSGFIGGLVGAFSAIADVAESQLAVEMYYVQKAIKNSEPMEYKVTVTLPGEILIHKLDGSTAGKLDGNTVTLILSEADMAALAGKRLVFHVESILKDCSKACNEENQPHLIWDGDEDGVTCNCVCESGYEVLPGERVCFNCDELCPMRGENLVTDPAACEINKCGCRCGEGYAMNNAGSKCITDAEKEAEDNQRAENGGPSKNEIREMIYVIIKGEDISQLPGWFLLNANQQENLLNILEASGFAVDRSNLLTSTTDMTTDQIILRMQEEENRKRRLEEIAQGQVEDEIDDRHRIQEVIIDEIGGSTRFVEYAGDAWDGIKNIIGFAQSPYAAAQQYVKDNLQGEIEGRIRDETIGATPATYEEAAAELIKNLPYMATKETVQDYYRYKEFFEKHCQEQYQCSEAEVKEAHQEALSELENYLGEIDLDNEKSVYGISRIEWAKSGNAYDRAFEKLRKLGK